MNTRLSLPDVTLICVDCDHPEKGLHAIRESMKHISYGKVILLTGEALEVKENAIEVITVNRIPSVEEYSRFMITDLADYIETSHALVVQWDGYVINPSAWTNVFLDFDYIGAPWQHILGYYGEKTVGNGGFSLRSIRLLKILREMNCKECYPEDIRICIDNRRFLEYLGMRFAPLHVAYRFSVKNEPYRGSFGWHSRYNPVPPIQQK